MNRATCVQLLLLFVLLCGLCQHCAVAQSGGWCQTGIQLLPNLTDLLSSSAHHYYGAADDECSSFYLTAVDTSPSATSPTVLLRTDETLNVSLVNQQPIPTSLLASGYRYVTGMEYFNLRLYAGVTTTLPLSLPSSSTSRRRVRNSAFSSSNVSSGIAVLSTVNLTVLHFYPLTRSVALQDIAIDYGDSTLYATAALSVTSLFHFSVAADGCLSPLPDVKLVSRPPFSAILGSALFYPGGLLFYVSWPTAAEGQVAVGEAASVSGSVLQYDVKLQMWSTLLNASTALPVTSMADFWSTSQPNFGSMHLIDGRSLYNYDSC